MSVACLVMIKEVSQDICLDVRSLGKPLSSLLSSRLELFSESVGLIPEFSADSLARGGKFASAVAEGGPELA